MRKRNFAFMLDNLFWFIIYLLPVFGFLIYISYGHLEVSLADFMSLYFLDLDINNVFVSAISDIFGSSGFLPFFDSTSATSMSIIVYLSYFVLIYFVHICVDLLMLLPRMLMHCMDKIGGAL